jgi:hypothetical protein
MTRVFDDFDFTEFREESDYADREYVGDSVTDGMVRAAEDALGYKLPASYVALLENHNGGLPLRTCHGTDTPTSWADDHVALTGIFGVDNRKPCSLCGEHGSRFWIEEWGYPPIGVYFADCPSAGHDMLCLDYRECGPDGEPRVVHVDQEFDFKITLVADDFEQFIRGLVSDEEFDEDDDDDNDDDDDDDDIDD